MENNPSLFVTLFAKTVEPTNFLKMYSRPANAKTPARAFHRTGAFFVLFRFREPYFLILIQNALKYLIIMSKSASWVIRTSQKTTIFTLSLYKKPPTFRTPPISNC